MGLLERLGRVRLPNVPPMVLIVVALLEVLLTSGALFGWPAMTSILLDEGQYSERCPSPVANTTLTPTTSSATSIATPTPTHTITSTPTPTPTPTTPTSSSTSARTSTSAPATTLASPSWLSTSLVRSSLSKARSSTAASSPPCKAQTEQLTLLFTIGSSVFTAISFPVGMCLDRIGPRYTNLIGSVCLLAGSLLFAFADSSTFNSFIPAVIFTSIGGPATFLSQFHLSGLYPRHQSLIVSLVNGAFDSSTVVFLLFEVLHSTLDLSHHTLFLAYSVLPLLMILLVWMWPRHSVGTAKALADDLARAGGSYGVLTDETEFDLEMHSHSHSPSSGKNDATLDASSLNGMDSTERYPLGLIENPNGTARRAEQESQSSLEEKPTVDHGDRQSVGNDKLGVDGDDKLEVDGDERLEVDSDERLEVDSDVKLGVDDEDTFGVDGDQLGVDDDLPVEVTGGEGALIANPFPGLSALSLKQQLRCVEYWTVVLFTILHMLRLNLYLGTANDQLIAMGFTDPQYSRLIGVLSVALPVGGMLAGPVVGSLLDRQGMFVGFLTVCTLSVLYGIASFFPVFWVQCVCFLLFSIYRPCLYSAATAYHSVIFGFENFGLLWGLTIFVSSLTNFLQYPISLLVNALLDGSYLIPNSILFILTVISYLFPCFIWWRSRRLSFVEVENFI